MISHPWHEALAGLSAVEMASSLVRFLKSEHLADGDSLVLWLDNCSYQNKSYVLFQALLSTIHLRLIPFREVTLKYFIPGHSFMAADSFHARVEQQLTSEETVLNFSSFRAACEQLPHTPLHWW